MNHAHNEASATPPAALALPSRDRSVPRLLAQVGATPPPSAPLVPLMLDAEQSAALCGIAVSSWHKWRASGLVPAPVRISRRVFWRRIELEAWIAAGCPSRDRWDAMSKEAHRDRT